MKELIQTFLDNPIYEVGVEIYRRYGSNNFLKQLFEYGYSARNLERLTEELKQLQEAEKPALSETKEVFELKFTNVITNVNENKKLPSELDDAPERIKKAIENRKLLYAEARILKATLPEEQDQEKRRDMCFQILSLFRKINDIWKLTNYYDDNLKLPPEIAFVPDDSIKEESSVVLNARFQNHYKYIQKFKNVLGKQDAVLSRLKEAIQIETELRERDAFQYSRYTLPQPDEIGGS